MKTVASIVTAALDGCQADEITPSSLARFAAATFPLQVRALSLSLSDLTAAAGEELHRRYGPAPGDGTRRHDTNSMTYEQRLELEDQLRSEGLRQLAHARLLAKETAVLRAAREDRDG